MKKSICIFLFLLCTSLWVFAQPMPPVAIPSPNAANLGMYGQIPVNYFNGLPSIGVPIHTINEHGLNMSIDLSYHASGVRPDHHPGWVGLGWNLNAGGVITRIVNGEPDEKITAGFTNPNNKSYLINYGELNRPDWDQNSTLSQILTKYNDINLAAGGVGPSADEFTFSFNGYAGSFFLDHTGTWRVKSSNGKAMKVDLTTSSFELTTSPNKPAITLRRIIDKIVLTAPDGIIYTFGGTAESIEFSRNRGFIDDANASVVPTSWFLTNVKLQSGEEVVLNYERGGYAIINTDSWRNFYFSSHDGSPITPSQVEDYIAETLINPVYLKEIITNNQTVTFSRSITNELKFQQITPRSFNNEADPPRFYQDIGNEGSKWFKLNSITITDNFNHKDIKKFELNYKDQPDSRLMLTSVREKDPLNLLSKNPYEFYYYDSPYFDLPIYTSRKLDHWGFFNNRSYFDHKPVGYQYTPADETAYKESRDSDPNYMLEGTLSHILYPTGGQTEFIFEANTYSYIAHSYDSTPYFNVENLGLYGWQKAVGGLRIKKIISKSGTGPEDVREFLYTVKDFPGASSGILGGEHVYVEKFYLSRVSCGFLDFSCMGASAQYWYFSNHSILPLSYTQGNHVTYSEVTEKFADGGYKVYKYSNHNNPLYRNTSVNNGGYINIASKVNTTFTDMSYTRGKLLSEQTYNSVNKLLKSVVREYNNDPNRFNDAIRVADISFLMLDGVKIGSQIVAYNKYLFEPYLKKITTDSYNQNDNNYVRQVTEYEYDNTTLLLKNEKNLLSDGTQLMTNYRYPKDKLVLSSAFGSGDLSIIDGMVIKNMVTPVLEKEFFRNNTFLSRESTIYNKHTFGLNDLYLPLVVKSRFANDLLDHSEIQFNAYDHLGNLLSFSKKDGPNTSYAWGYNKTLPIAQATNAAPNEFLFQGFEEEPSISPGNAHTGKKAFIGAYQIPFVKPNGKNYILSYWKYVGNTWVRSEVDYTTDNLILNEGVPIDDITIYPSDSQIQTYTYHPLIGMSSQTNIFHNTNYYEYDLLGRLEFIKNDKGNIIKKYAYNFANTAANWVNTGINSECDDFADVEYGSQSSITGYTKIEQMDTNPFSLTHGKTRKVVDAFTPSVCLPSYYFKLDIDPYLEFVTIHAKRSYDDGTTKTMRFRVRHDSVRWGSQVIEEFVDIVVSGASENIGSYALFVGAGSYIEVELVDVF